jgi:hypothetical protein
MVGGTAPFEMEGRTRKTPPAWPERYAAAVFFRAAR